MGTEGIIRGQSVIQSCAHLTFSWFPAFPAFVKFDFQSATKTNAFNVHSNVCLQFTIRSISICPNIWKVNLQNIYLQHKPGWQWDFLNKYSLCPSTKHNSNDIIDHGVSSINYVFLAAAALSMHEVSLLQRQNST